MSRLPCVEGRLRKKLGERLDSEWIRGRWENGKNQGDANLERFLSAVEAGMDSVDPALTENQSQAILNTARIAWQELWYPPPANCAEEYRHPYLNDLDRGKVMARLEELDELGAPAIVELLNAIAANEDELRRVREEVTRTEAVGPHVDSKRERLSVLNGEIQDLDQEVGALRREMVALESQINQKNTELTRMAGQWDAAKPAVRRAVRALKVSSMVDEVVAKAVPSQIQADCKGHDEGPRVDGAQEASGRAYLY